MLTELPPLPEPDIQSFGGLASYSHFRMHAYGQACQAATLATVTPLVQQMLEALENTSDLVFKDVRLSHTRNLALLAARAFLSGATKEGTDHG